MPEMGMISEKAFCATEMEKGSDLVGAWGVLFYPPLSLSAEWVRQRLFSRQR